MDNPLAIFGAGGHAKVILDALNCANVRPDFLVEDHRNKSEMFGVPLLSREDSRWQSICRFRFVVAVGNNQNRRRIFQELVHKGGTPINVIHPKATVSPRAHLGVGVVVFAGAVLNADGSIDDNSIVNTSASIDHDCRIGAHAHICPGVHLGGHVTVGTGALIGIGAAVLPRTVIGDWTVVGAGSVVNRDLPSNVVAFGCPARVQREVDPDSAA